MKLNARLVDSNPHFSTHYLVEVYSIYDEPTSKRRRCWKENNEKRRLANDDQSNE